MQRKIAAGSKRRLRRAHAPKSIAVGILISFGCESIAIAAKYGIVVSDIAIDSLLACRLNLEATM
jgi:hypothetical protein